VFGSSPFSGALPEDALRAAVEQAHAAGKPSFVHPDSADDVAIALRARVDVIAHTTPRSVWDLSLLELIEGSDAALIPTLWLWKWYARHNRLSTQQRVVEAMTEQLRLWIDAGRPVLFGTDDGAVDHDPTEEYALMSQSGMNFRAILASLTTAPAARFGESHHLGRITNGFTADIAVLSGDPSTDIRAVANMQYTLRDGRIVNRPGEKTS
jgi:imidazolonepropionase-like amidohydrolase